jgi:hypothetical protein
LLGSIAAAWIAGLHLGGRRQCPLIRRGVEVGHVMEFSTRGQAGKYSLSLLARRDDAGAITLERELVDGEVLQAVSLGRRVSAPSMRLAVFDVRQ